MTSAPAPPLVVFPFGEPDARLEDFLDDKLQSTADLDTIDTLLARVQVQHGQLQDQLDDAAHELDRARETAAAKHDSLQAAIDQFDQLEKRIDERLVLVNAENAAPEAVIQQLAAPMEQLHRVTLAHDYLVLLQDVATWADEARAALPDRPQDALKPYGQIRRLARRLQELQTDDVSAPHLVAYVADVADKLWQGMNATMRASFSELLEARQWTVGRVDPELVADETWRDGFAKLLALQKPEVVAAAEAPQQPPQILLPIAVMAEFFVLEFRYHFLAMGEGRQTSEPQRTGQLCFPWYLQRVDRWTEFMRRSFAPILKQQFRNTAAWQSTAYRDPACALMAAMLPVLRQKVRHTTDFAVGLLNEQRKHQQEQHLQQNPQYQQQQADAADDEVLLNAPTFLGVLIGQLLEFDEELRQRGYDGGIPRPREVQGTPAPDYASNNYSWPGLAGEVLDEHFELWLRAEKEYAVSRYREIVDGDSKVALEARATIDYDYAPRGYTKPTLAAEHVVDLLRAVTAQYRLVRRFSHRRRFLIDIQVTLLDQYHDRLRGTLEAYSAMTSTLGRTLHGFSFSKEQLAQLEGTGSLEVLCRVYGSADLVIDTLRGWSDESFFLSLSQELNARAEAAAASGESGERTTTKTSQADDDDDGLFSSNIQAYESHRDAAESLLVSALIQSHGNALRPYILRTHWTTQTAGDEEDEVKDKAQDKAGDESDNTISPELDEPLRVIQRNLAFLANALGKVPLRRIVRKAMAALEQQLFNDLLLKSKFTGPGAAQFARDVAALKLVVEREVPVAPGAAATASFEWLRQGTVLLTLPAKQTGSADALTLTLQEADEIMFQGARLGNANHDNDGTDETNEGARGVLLQLGLTSVDEAHAHKIVRRRVELQG
ncbi:rint-1 family protein [Ophiostoma piceae UAMH 11346]|uniref:Rint-1 family protein n=1 Tax=Ophiostoma piceae (strain UAMH 11346) TaxID=1262450 RepID=S3CRP9_OPHP1|nr:rint-1 family protein [Ophiostoma piceae UAMH 11346]